VLLYRRHPTAPVVSPNPIERAGALTLILVRGPDRGMGRREDMTRTDHGQRPVGAVSWLVISGRGGMWTKADPLGPSDPRNARRDD
jgi:hypothetical protein